MFRSQSMCKVEIVVPEHNIIAVTEALAQTQTLHIGNFPDTNGDLHNTEVSEWQAIERRFVELTQRIKSLMTSLGVSEDKHPDEVLRWIDPDLAERDIQSLEREASDPVQRLQSSHDKLSELEAIRSELLPFVSLNVDLETFRKSRYVFSMFGFIPKSNIDRLRTSLETIPTTLVVFSEKDALAAVGLFGLMRDTDTLRRAARSAYLNPINVPSEYRGTPREILTSLHYTIERTRERIVTYQDEVHILQETRIRRMRHLLWRLRVSLHLVQIISGFRKFKYTYLITGWVPESVTEKIKQCIADNSENAVVKLSALNQEERRHAPFFFKNPPVIHQFQQLVTTYSYPAYNELDPTLLMAVTFPLIFGVMFGDVGHGTLLLILGLLLISRRIKLLDNFSQMGGIVATCGGASLLFGALYGSVFGYEDILPALWLRPLANTEQILVATVIFGVITLSIGIIFNIVSCAQRQAWGRMLFSNTGLAGLLFFLSLVGLGASLISPTTIISLDILLPVLVVSASSITLAGVLEPLVEGHTFDRAAVGMTLMEGFFELFESVISLMSNTLSFVRMGAFAVAHGALSLVIFILAELVSPGHGPGYWVVVVLGTLFIVGFEGMIVAIQTLRLEYYELFSKFFIGGGVRYSPMDLLPAENITV